jgi:hypothetical protein
MIGRELVLTAAQTIYNEEWGQSLDSSKPWPEFRLTDLVRSLDPTRLVNAVSGWTDHTAGDFDVSPQCGTCLVAYTNEQLQGQPSLLYTSVWIALLVDLGW